LEGYQALLKAATTAGEAHTVSISSSGFDNVTLLAIRRSAKRLNDVAPRAFSKAEIEQFFKKI
jgi:hypothetical protein